MKNLVTTIKSWNVEMARKLQEQDRDNEWHLITNPGDFTPHAVAEINPHYIFVPHWSWIIPKEIWGNYETVVFHETDLPFGRGGSPIQNLIARGIYNTKISALRVDEGIDTGAIYMKSDDIDISKGTVEDILKKCSEIIFNEMIPEIIRTQPKPVPQQGEAVVFKRRTPEQGDISKFLGERDYRKAYDYVRMLDGEGYPKAYVPVKGGRFEFSDASLEGGKFDACIDFVEEEKDE
jgi:methionyl-tRNA formyltransferase